MCIFLKMGDLVWRKHCNHLHFQVIKCAKKLNFLFLSRTDGPANRNIWAGLQGKSNIFYYKMQYNVLSNTVLIRAALLADHCSGEWRRRPCHEEEWVSEREYTQLRRLVEEVMLVSTWVWLASTCTVSLCQVMWGWKAQWMMGLRINFCTGLPRRMDTKVGKIIP